MTKYILTIKEGKESEALLNFLKNLNFIPNIEVKKDIQINKITKSCKVIDWTELAGIWEDYDITTDKIREKAWPKRI